MVQEKNDRGKRKKCFNGNAESILERYDGTFLRLVDDKSREGGEGRLDNKTAIKTMKYEYVIEGFAPTLQDYVEQGSFTQMGAKICKRPSKSFETVEIRAGKDLKHNLCSL